MWKREGPFSFEPIAELGSDCRIWMSVSQGIHLLGFCAFLAMPTQASSEHETRWHKEIDGLTSSWNSYGSPHLFLAGDFNVQPSVLSGQADPRPKRDLALRTLLSKWSLSLLNPPVAVERSSPVQLPLQRVLVHIRAGDTHHAGNPRAIDLALCPSHTQAEAVVHNGLHCTLSSPCSWGLCNDFCKSEHFLVAIVACFWPRSIENNQTSSIHELLGSGTWLVPLR